MASKPDFEPRGREPRGPDVGGDEVRAGVGLQGDLQQVPGVEPQDRPSVRMEVADPREAPGHPVHRLEVRGVDEMVNLPGLVELLVDGRDLDRKHEPGGGRAAPAGRRQPAFDEPLQIGPQAVEARLRGHELLLQLRPPRRMREVAGADDGDAFLARPEREVFEITAPAGRARVLGVHVQIGVEDHAVDTLALRDERGAFCTSAPRRYFQGRPWTRSA